MIRPGVRRLFTLLLRRPDAVRRGVDDEIAFHLSERAQQLEREGWTPEAARHEAERRFGTVEARQTLRRAAQLRERSMTVRERIDDAIRDVRFAARGLRRDRMFTAFAIVTLALGIGANAAMYGIADRLLLRGPDHVVNPQRLVRFAITVTLPKRGDVTSSTLGYVSYLKLREATRVFDGLAAYKIDDLAFGRGEAARTLRAGYATADFFPLVGVRAARGRFFTADEDRTTGPDQVVVLSDALWRGEYGGDPGIVGKTIALNEGPFTVIGIAPRGFTGVDLSRVDLWLPMSLTGGVTSDWTRTWNAQWLRVVGRLKAGVSREVATLDATAAHRRTYDGSGELWARARMSTVPIHFTKAGREPLETTVARWLLGVALAVLLIACTNVANLLLARTIRRRREVAVRLALGIGRRRLMRLFVAESLLLAMAGGTAAVAVAAIIANAVRGSLLANIEWTSSLVSTRVLLFAMLATLATGVLVGLAPALHAARGSVMSVMKAGDEGGRARPVSVRAWPMILQASLTTALLVGAGLFLRSLQRAQSAHLGFDGDRVLVAATQWAASPPASGPEAAAARRAARKQVYARAMERSRALPGVQSAALAVGSPFGNSFTMPLFVPGWDSIPRLGGGGPYVSAVTSDYFATVGTRLVRGRGFTASEGTGTAPVAIVNTTMAATLWPGREALGNCLKVGADSAPCAEIVGIVEPARRQALKEPPSMQYYIPLGQESGFGGTVLMLRTENPASLAPTVRRALSGFDPLVETVTARSLQESIDPLTRPWRLGTTIFGLSGVLALVVAALGLYSVMSYAVAQRTHEMGVRIALGAQPRNIVRLIVGESLAMALAGVTLGIGVALYGGRFLQGVLFDTSARDPVVLGTAVVALVAVAILASLLPALRAIRVDPIGALKAE